MYSRIITFPDHVTKDNHTVVLVDPDQEFVTNLTFFLKTSKKEYDVYVYLGEHQDLEYLKSITDLADRVFISSVSAVHILNSPSVEVYESATVPLDYFSQVDNG